MSSSNVSTINGHINSGAAAGVLFLWHRRSSFVTRFVVQNELSVSSIGRGANFLFNPLSPTNSGDPYIV